MQLGENVPPNPPLHPANSDYGTLSPTKKAQLPSTLSESSVAFPPSNTPNLDQDDDELQDEDEAIEANLVRLGLNVPTLCSPRVIALQPIVVTTPKQSISSTMELESNKRPRDSPEDQTSVARPEALIPPMVMGIKKCAVPET